MLLRKGIEREEESFCNKKEVKYKQVVEFIGIDIWHTSGVSIRDTGASRLIRVQTPRASHYWACRSIESQPIWTNVATSIRGGGWGK